MFAVLSGATAVVCLGLAAILILGPQHYLGLYNVAVDPGAVFLGRRAAPLLLGLAVVFWCLRDVAPGAVRDTVAWSAAVAFGGIAVSGVAAYVGGTASVAILVAAAIEVAIAAAFLLAR